jgi:bacterioferritin-associated ferredoxin
MFVCICHGITDHQIREAAENGCRSVSELTMRTGAGSSCGTCMDMAADLLSKHGPVDRAFADLPLLELPVLQAA